jgi:hypothetical protein
MTPYGEDLIEVAVSSWEYPELLVGYSEEKALFDLKGIAWVLDQIGRCQPTK